MHNVYIWHDAVHQQRAGSKLLFWRLSFGPEYDEAEVRATFLRLFENYEIESYVIYEVLGEFDLILRFWMPLGRSADDLEADFDRALRAAGLWSHQFMSVKSIARHWAWEAGEAPTEGALASVNWNQVESIAEYNASVMAHRGTEPMGTSRRRPQAQETSLDPPDWIESLVRENLIRPINLDQKGIKFFIHLDLPQRPFRTQNELFQVKEDLEQACSEAVAVEYPNGAGTVSLYVGTGSLTNFLIVARAPDGDFYEFVRQLVFGMRKKRSLLSNHIRPYTHVAADRTFREFADFPSLASVHQPLGELLDHPESSVLEFKGTLSVNVDRLLHDGTKESDPKREADVVRAVCGLLNGRRAGRLVVGALESERYKDRLAELVEKGATIVRRSSTQRDVWEPADLAIVVSSEARTDYEIVLGVEFETSNGAKFQSWDEFVRHLNDLLSSRIEPNPIGHVGITPERIGSATLANISVIPSRTSWFYAQSQTSKAKDEFLVRENASTKLLTGSTAENYQRAFDRNGRGGV